MLYIRNLRSDINEAQLKEKFEAYGPIERVKRVKSYGFVHFSTRELAIKAMEELNGTVCLQVFNAFFTFPTFDLILGGVLANMMESHLANLV